MKVFAGEDYEVAKYYECDSEMQAKAGDDLFGLY